MRKRTGWLLSLLLVASMPALAAGPDRLELAIKAYRLASVGYRDGRVEQATVVEWSARIYELQVAANVATAASDLVFRMSELEAAAAQRSASGKATELEVLNAQYLKLDAELKAKKKK